MAWYQIGYTPMMSLFTGICITDPGINKFSYLGYSNTFHEADVSIMEVLIFISKLYFLNFHIKETRITYSITTEEAMPINLF